MTVKTWSIAEVERETGLGKDALRVWERRYGFPVPMRDKLGERAYPDEQVQRLRLLKRLLDAGYRPGKVVPLPASQLQDLLQAASRPGAGAVRQRAAAAHHELEDADVWVQWLSTDRTDKVRQALQQQILREGLGHVVDRLVAPLCRLVGQAWMRGEISVYQEHLFTETLQSVLREAIASVDAGGQTLQQRPRVLLTTTPTEQHGLGLLMAECHFALESCERFVLGTSTPIADIVLAVRQLHIDVLALSFSAYASRRDLIESLQQLRDQLPQAVDIWVGGAAAATHARSLPPGVALMRQTGEIASHVRSWRERQQA
jgi:DNA-binding transcriptional MerR regulator